MSHDELILVVNEADEPIGSAPKREIQQKGLIHRIAQVMVEDPTGRILLQKRAPEAEFRPNAWDTSVGGHVDEGEDYLDAAYREMSEEIGLTGVKLEDLGEYRKYSMHEWRHLNRFYKLYRVVVPADTQFTPEPSEVAEVHWFTLDEVKRLINDHPDQCTGGIIEAIKRFYP